MCPCEHSRYELGDSLILFSGDVNTPRLIFFKKHYFNEKCQRLDVCKFTFIWIILCINPLSAGIDIRHHNLTSVYVKKVKVQVYSLISSISYQVWHLHFYPLVTGPVDLCVIPTLRKSDSFAAHWTYHPHCHLCPTSYSFSPDLSEAVKG